MKEFRGKYLSRQALQQHWQTMVRKNKDENDNRTNAEETTTDTKNTAIKSAFTKTKLRINNFFVGYRDFLFGGDGIQWAVAIIPVVFFCV